MRDELIEYLRQLAETNFDIESDFEKHADEILRLLGFTRVGYLKLSNYVLTEEQIAEMKARWNKKEWGLIDMPLIALPMDAKMGRIIIKDEK